MTNLDDRTSTGTHWVSLFIDRNTAVYFDSIGTEHFPEKVLNKIRDKLITNNIIIVEDNKSLMRGFYCIAFIEICSQEKLC